MAEAFCAGLGHLTVTAAGGEGELPGSSFGKLWMVLPSACLLTAVPTSSCGLASHAADWTLTENRLQALVCSLHLALASAWPSPGHRGPRGVNQQ